jgi:hypothetical protein
VGANGRILMREGEVERETAASRVNTGCDNREKGVGKKGERPLSGRTPTNTKKGERPLAGKHCVSST